MSEPQAGYVVEPLREKGELRYVVRTPEGRIANGWRHPSEDSAARHAHSCNAFSRAWNNGGTDDGQDDERHCRVAG